MSTRSDRYVIEARDAQGQLLLDSPQPESFFGMGAIQGLDTDQMAKAIFRQVPEAVLTGDSVPLWPRLIDPNWTARRKTW